MGMGSPRESARLYRFVPRTRTVPQAPLAETGSVTAIRPQVRPITAEFGSGWYHEAAIEAERIRRQ